MGTVLVPENHMATAIVYPFHPAKIGNCLQILDAPIVGVACHLG